MKQGIAARLMSSTLAPAASPADAQFKDQATWNTSQGSQTLALHDAGSNLQLFRTWFYGTP